MNDYKLDYDTEAGGPFVEGELLTFQGGGIGELVLLYDNGLVGEMYFSLISGSIPAAAESITGGTSTATANVAVTAFASRFPLKIRDDIEYASATGNIRLNAGAPALGTTHSAKYDAEATGPFVNGEILTFGNGSTAELIEFTDAGLTGELFFRMIDVELPADNDTITSSGTATAVLNGAVHTRCFTPNNLHYWFSDKGDDAAFIGNDEQDRTKPRVSKRIGVSDVELLGDANIDDALSYKIYGGSISQAAGGGDEYNAIAISIVDADGNTEPVVVQASGNSQALLSATTTEYWKNGYMPNAASKINMVIKVKAAGVIVDRRVVRFRALEFGRQYFTAPDPTMSGGITPVSLVATDDGNNTTLAATVAGWVDILDVEGLQTVDHGNGNGDQPYWLTLDLGATKTKTQGHERAKWVQRRGTAEVIHAINAQLIVGNDLTIQYDGEGNTVQFNEGEIIDFTGNSSGSALILALDDQGVTGTLYCQRLTGDAPIDNANITGATSGEVALVAGTPVTRLIINNMMGTYTGSAFNPANIGVTLLADDADENDLFTDLLEVQQQPPTNRTGAVNTTTGNTATIYPWDGVAVDAVGDQEPDFNRLTNSGLVNGAAVTSIVVNQAIPTWMPQSTGYLRATLVSGTRRLLPVNSWSGSTFQIDATDFSGDNIADVAAIMPAPGDGVVAGGVMAFSGIYTADQDGDAAGDQQFVVRVTNGSAATPKQPSTNVATFGSGGFSLNVSLQDD